MVLLFPPNWQNIMGSISKLLTETKTMVYTTPHCMGPILDSTVLLIKTVQFLLKYFLKSLHLKSAYSYTGKGLIIHSTFVSTNSGTKINQDLANFRMS